MLLKWNRLFWPILKTKSLNRSSSKRAANSLLCLKLKLYKMEIGVVKYVYKTMAKCISNYYRKTYTSLLHYTVNNDNNNNF